MTLTAMRRVLGESKGELRVWWAPERSSQRETPSRRPARSRRYARGVRFHTPTAAPVCPVLDEDIAQMIDELVF